MNRVVFITGGRGYLAGGLYNILCDTENCRIHHGDVRQSVHYQDISTILHFASPSEHPEFLDRSRTRSTIINGTLNMLELAKQNDAKFVFASTMGVCDVQPDNIYTSCKLKMENYIKSVYNNYIILRIPRVYSKCRKKGLMRRIRDNTVPEADMDRMIEFITLDDFIVQTLPVLPKCNITHEYEITQRRSIREIKQWINE